MVRFPEPIITSLLDNDLYKLTMMQAARHKYKDLIVRYSFINRGKTEFPDGFAEEFRYHVNLIGKLSFTSEDIKFLSERCGHYLDKENFIPNLEHFQLNPENVHESQIGGTFKVTVEGIWYQTILWEVILLALISELYFRMMGQKPAEDYLERARRKAERLHDADVIFSDFGTRRRFSHEVHESLMPILIDSGKEHLRGTSNVDLARRYNLTPIGTHAHEWFMAHAGMFGFRSATREALKSWAREFGGYLGYALTDTFTTDVFLIDFNAELARLFDGVRHDSGDPFTFVDKIVAHYGKLRIHPGTRQIVFADALTEEKAIAINEYCRGKIFQASFGIGTYLTNDVGVKPLNIVIKLSQVMRPEEPGRWIDVVKFSDDYGKVSGNQIAIEHGRYELGLAA